MKDASKYLGCEVTKVTINKLNINKINALNKVNVLINTSAICA